MIINANTNRNLPYLFYRSALCRQGCLTAHSCECLTSLTATSDLCWVFRQVAVIGGYVKARLLHILILYVYEDIWKKVASSDADSVCFRKHMKFGTDKIDFNIQQQRRQNQHQTFKLSSFLFDNQQEILQNPANNRQETICHGYSISGHIFDVGTRNMRNLKKDGFRTQSWILPSGFIRLQDNLSLRYSRQSLCRLLFSSNSKKHRRSGGKARAR